MSMADVVQAEKCSEKPVRFVDYGIWWGPLMCLINGNVLEHTDGVRPWSLTFFGVKKGFEDGDHQMMVIHATDVSEALNCV